MPVDCFGQAQAFFNADRFRYLVHLKALHLYRESLACFYSEQVTSIGALLSYPTSTTAWDEANYSQSRFVLLPVATDASAAETILQHVRKLFNPTDSLVFKFCDRATRDVFTSALALQPAKTFISYTGQTEQHFTAAPLVTLSPTLDRACYVLHAANGYTSEELDQAVSEGAFSVARYIDGHPVSACFVFRNFADVWEIAGLRTVPAAQRQGYARDVVQTALYAIQIRGFWPRYVVEKNNIPSIRLAEALELRPCLYLEHFLSTTD